MKLKTYSRLTGHAFLSPSQYHWINYDDDRLIKAWEKSDSKKKGLELHEVADRLIKLNVKLPKKKTTINLYVNDAIGYGMTPEQTLYFSDNCFGTADAISFKNNYLRIHDLKTGEVPGSMSQLEIYAALFCLEYQQDPFKIKMELRLYQSDIVTVHEPEPDRILSIMDKIVHFDKLIEQYKLD